MEKAGGLATVFLRSMAIEKMASQIYIFQHGQMTPTKEGIEQHSRQTGSTEDSTEVQRWDNEGGKIRDDPIVKIGTTSKGLAWETFGEDDINE